MITSWLAPGLIPIFRIIAALSNNSNNMGNEKWRTSHICVNCIIKALTEFNNYIKNKKTDTVGLLENKLSNIVKTK